MLKNDLADLKSEVDKLDIDKFKNVPTGLSSLKSKMDKLDIDKLEITPVDLIKLSDVANHDAVKKADYIGMVKKFNAIDISKFVNKANYGAKIKVIELEIPSVIGLATIVDLNAKINEPKGEMPSISVLATTIAFTAVKKIPNLSNLVKRQIIMQKHETLKKIF